MDENKVLLSQMEIDVLVEFLLQQKEKVGEVMDQASIDRLIALLRPGMAREKKGTPIPEAATEKLESPMPEQMEEFDIKYDSLIPEPKGSEQTPILLLEEELECEQKDCVLECEADAATGYLGIFCADRKSGKRYRITPKCVEQVRYIKGDASEWGYALPPLAFDQIAALMKVKYTKKTFDKVCEIFAVRIFGTTDQQIPNLYMPTVNSLIHHLAD